MINKIIINFFLILSIAGMINAGEEPSLVVSGVIIHKDEIWDRRPNRQMGRPDILKEIVMHVTTLSLYKGTLPVNTREIHISIKGQKLIISYKGLSAGTSGIFYLTGREMPYDLIDFKPLESRCVQSNSLNADKTKECLDNPEKISGRELIKSRELQEKMVQIIAKKYNMKNASIVTLVSYSGPCPPEGGYIYWGVKGQIRGKWYIWQAGANPDLREGTELTDPKRYQKCNSPFTMILTPSGRVPIKDLKAGDMVLSGGFMAVPILKTVKVKTENHKVCRITLDDGTILEISPGHPLADNRLIQDLKVNDRIDNRQVIKTELVPYEFSFTYDILPDSPSGIYYAHGIRMRSTIKGK